MVCSPMNGGRDDERLIGGVHPRVRLQDLETHMVCSLMGVLERERVVTHERERGHSWVCLRDRGVAHGCA